MVTINGKYSNKFEIFESCLELTEKQNYENMK